MLGIDRYGPADDESRPGERSAWMIDSVFERTMPNRGDHRGSRRLPSVCAVILLSVFCALASLAVATVGPASAAELFTNPSPITISDGGPASPYPSEIAVSGLNGPITDMSVTLHRFGHDFTGDADILLVSPGGEGVVLMSDACGGSDIEDFTWTFSDSAPGSMSGDCSSFAYQPTNVSGTPDNWPTPAPPGPYSTSLSAFNNEAANGTWKLYVVDDIGNGLGGDIEGGWSISIQTAPFDLAIPGSGTSGPASLYPATQTVSGKSGLITDLNVYISGIWHRRPDDLDLLLVGPRGQKVVLMSDACGSFGVEAYGWEWDDEETTTPMPDGDGTDVCGTTLQGPADYEPGDVWPTPAPPGPYFHSLTAFHGTNPNGSWRLFVYDDSSGATGFFTNRFQLRIETDTTPPRVTSTGPPSNATGVGLAVDVGARFSEAMRAGSINRNSFELFRAGTTTEVAATVTYGGMAGRAILDPNANLQPGTRYKAVMTPGAKDLSGNGLDQDPNVAGNQQKIWFFTTRR